MSEAKKKWVDSHLGAMDLDQKVGQLMVFGMSGTAITPDTIDLIKNHHLGAVRICQGWRVISLINDLKPGEEMPEIVKKSLHLPKGLNRDFSYRNPPPSANPAEFAEVLNRMRQMSIDRKGSIPLHFTIDQEGNGSDDMLGGQPLFPHPMGIAATGDPTLAYRIAKQIGKMARALGANMIHSPVLDVNTDPENPEIGTRAYSDNAKDVIAYALQSLKGFQETGLIAVGKHFPGRGESKADAHYGLPTVNVDYETLMKVHVAPYIELIKAGLPSIMSAHSLYPALNETTVPSSMSRKIVTDFLRGELGFKGVITTDNMMMGGILRKYEMSEAIVQTLIAGNDLVLMRDESPIRYKILEAVKQAVKEGRLPEKELDEKVERILGMRWDMGLAVNGGLVDPQGAIAAAKDPECQKVAVEAAQKSVLVLRDRKASLPLSPEKRVLLVEQVFPMQLAANNMYCHAGMFWEELSKLSNKVGSVEIPNTPSDADRERVRRRLREDDYDVIITTNYYHHKHPLAIADIVNECIATGKPVIVMANSLYKTAAREEFPTVIVCFNPASREQIRSVAEVIYGKLKHTATVPVNI